MLPRITFTSSSLLLQAAVHTMGLRETENYCQAQIGPVNPEYSKPWIMNPDSKDFFFFLARISVFENVFFRLLRDILLIIYFYLGSNLCSWRLSPLQFHTRMMSLWWWAPRIKTPEIWQFYFCSTHSSSLTSHSEGAYLFPCLFYFLRCSALLHVFACNSQNVMS